MKKKLFFILFGGILFFCHSVSAQIGIGVASKTFEFSAHNLTDGSLTIWVCADNGTGMGICTKTIELDESQSQQIELPAPYCNYNYINICVGSNSDDIGFFHYLNPYSFYLDTDRGRLFAELIESSLGHYSYRIIEDFTTGIRWD